MAFLLISLFEFATLLTFYVVARRFVLSQDQALFIAATVSGIFYLFIPLLEIRIASGSGFLTSFVFSLMLYAAMFAIAIKFLDKEKICFFTKKIGLNARYLLWLLLLLSYYIYMSDNLVAQAWDFLDYWGKRAIKIFEHVVANDAFETKSSDRHPITVSEFHAKSIAVSQFFSIQPLIPNTYLIYLLHFAILLYASAKLFSVGTMAAFFVSLSVISLPLLENSFLIFGYSELFALSVFYSAVCMAYFGFRDECPAMLIAAVSVSVLLLYIRSTGIVFCSILIVSVIVTVMRSRPYIIVMTTVAILVTIPVFQTLPSSTSFEIKNWILRLSGGRLSLSFGYYNLFFELPPMRVFLTNVVHALFTNSSFGIHFTFILMFLVSNIRLFKLGKPDFFLVFITILSIGHLYLIHLSAVGLQISGVNSDVFLSRSALVTVPLSALIAFRSFHMMVEQRA